MGRSNISGVLNDFIKDEYEPTILGSIPFMGEKEGLEAVDAADAAFNNRVWHHESGR
jgi:hypothetical protein